MPPGLVGRLRVTAMAQVVRRIVVVGGGSGRGGGSRGSGVCLIRHLVVGANAVPLEEHWRCGEGVLELEGLLSPLPAIHVHGVRVPVHVRCHVAATETARRVAVPVTPVIPGLVDNE